MSQALRNQLSAYQAYPHLYSEEQIDTLEKAAGQAGIPFQRNLGVSEASLLSQVAGIPGQFASGFLHGFSTIPTGPDPRGDIEGISRSIGHLLGFIGIIPGVGTMGSIGTKALVGTGKGLAWAGKLGAASKVLQAAPKIAKFKSAPMYVADVITKKAGETSAGKAVGNYLGSTVGGEIGKQMTKGGFHLGAASTVAAWPEAWEGGVDQFLIAGMHGAVFGGFFGGVGNIPGLKGVTTRAKVMRGMAGAAFQGIPTTLQGQTTPNQVYNYLLGGYFGAKSHTWEFGKARDFVEKQPHTGKIAATTAPGFESLQPQVQKEVKNYVSELYSPKESQAGVYQIFKNMFGNIWEKDLDAIVTEVTEPMKGRVTGGTHKLRFEGKEVEIVEDGAAVGKKMSTIKDPDTGLPIRVRNENLEKTTVSTLDPSSTARPLFEELDSKLKAEAETTFKELKELMKDEGWSDAQVRDSIKRGQLEYKSFQKDPIAWIEGKIKDIKADRDEWAAGETDYMKKQTPEDRADMVNFFQEDINKYQNILKELQRKDTEAKSEDLDTKDSKEQSETQTGDVDNPDTIFKGVEEGESRGADADVREPIKMPVMAFLERLVGKTVSSSPKDKKEMGHEEFFMHLRNIQERIANKKLTEDPADWDVFKEEMRNLKHTVTGERDITDSDFATIRPFYIRQTQSTMVKRMRWDTTKNQFVVEEDFDGKGNRIDRRQPPTLVGEIAVQLGLVEKPEDAYFEVRNVSGQRWQSKVGAHKWNSEKGANQQKAMIAHARKLGYYFYSGKSSSNVFMFMKFNVGDAVAEYARISEGFTSVYKNFKGDYSKIEKNYIDKGWGTAEDFRNEFISNIKWWETQNNLPIEQLMTNYSEALFKGLPNSIQGKIKKAGIEENWYSLNKTELTQRDGIGPKTADKILKVLADNKEETNPFLRSVLNFNKRQQPIFNTYYALDKHFFPEKFNYVVTKDFHRYLKELGFDVESSDGGAIIRDDILNKGLESQGLPAGGGFWKPFVVSPSGRGLMLGKLAMHGAGKRLSKEMERRGIEIIFPESTLKQTGNVKFLEMQYGADKKLSFTRNGQSVDDAKFSEYVYNMSPSDIKVSFGTYDSIPATIGKNARVLKALGDNIAGDQVDPEVHRDYTRFLEARYLGNEGVNKEFVRLLNKRDWSDGEKGNEEISKALDTLLGSNFDNFSKLGLKVINDAMKHNTPFGKIFRERARLRMLRTSTTGMESDVIDTFRESGEDVEDIVSSAMRWLSVSDGSDAMTYSKIASGSWDRAISSYFVKRIIQPKMPYSSKGIMRMYDLGLYRRTNEDGPTANLLKEGESKVFKGILNENIFYLDEGFRKLKIMGVNSEGNWETMTLEKQWNLFRKEKLRKGKSTVARQKMIRALNSVAVRTPMDDISGAANLYFGGFSGRQGGGILLHPKIMKRLGGADLDIDSAFIYMGNHPSDEVMAGNRGLPESYFRALKTHATSQDLNKEYINREYGGEENLRKYFLKDVENLPLRDSPVSMFDPYSRFQTAYAVQQGTGNLMGVAVKGRFLMRAFYKMAKDASDKNGEYVRILTDQSGAEIGKITFKVSKSEEDLRAKSSMAINMAADAASYGQIITDVEMRAIMIDSAFDKITIKMKDEPAIRVPKIRKDRPQEISDILLEFATPGFSRGEETLTSGANIYRTPFGTISKMSTRLFGRDWAADRSYTRAEKQFAAESYLTSMSRLGETKDTTVMSFLGEKLNELDYVDSFFHRIRTNSDKWTSLFNKVNNIVATSDWLKRYLPDSWKNRKQIVPVKYYEGLVGLLKNYYAAPDTQLANKVEMNIATEKGINELARAQDTNGQFWHFYQSWIDMSLANIKGKTPAETKRLKKNFIRNLKTRKIDKRTLRGDYGFEKRKQFIRDRVQEANDFASNDLWDITTIKTINDIGDFYGIPTANITVTPEFLNNHPGFKGEVRVGETLNLGKLLVKESEQIRLSFDAYFQDAKFTDPDVSPIYSGFDGISKVIAGRKEALTLLVEDYNAKLPIGATKLDVQGVHRFLEATLLGSIGRDQRTESYRFAPMLASQPVLKLFGHNYVKHFEFFQDRASRSEISDWWHTNALKRQVVEKEKQLEVLKNTWKELPDSPDKLDKIKLDKNTQKTVDNITEILKTYPEFAENPDAVMGILQKYFGVAKITDMSKQDLLGMEQLLISWKKGRGFFNWFTRKDGAKIFKGLRETMGDKLRVGWGAWMKPIENVANDHYKNDLIVINERLPVDTLTKEGAVRKVYVDAAVPMTHMGKLINTVDKIYSLPNEVRALDDIEMQQLLGWAQTLKNEQGMDKSDLLFALAWRVRERDGAIKWRDQLKREGKTEEELKDAQDDVNTFVKRVEEKYEDWLTVKDGKFQVGEEKITGQEVIDRLVVNLGELMEDYIYNNKIALSDVQLKRHIVINKKGNIDIHKTIARSAERIFKHGLTKTEDPMSLNMARLLWYENYLDNLARDVMKLEGKDFEGTAYEGMFSRTEGNVRSLKGILPESPDGAKTPTLEQKYLKGRTKDYIVTFLKTVLRHSSGDKGLTTLSQKRFKPKAYLRSEKQMSYKKGLDFMLDEYWGATPEVQAKIVRSFNTILDYMERRNRAVWKKGETYSQYDMDLALAKNRISKSEYFKEYMRQGSGGTDFTYREIPKRHGYMPHTQFTAKSLDDSIMKLSREYEAQGFRGEELDAKLEQLSRIRSGLLAEETTPDGLINEPVADVMMSESRGIEQLSQLGGNKTFGNMLKRSYNFSGYSYDVGVLDNYLWKLNRATYINMASLLAENNIRSFEKRAPMGKELTKDWVWYMRSYVRDVMGYPSTFPQAMIESPTMTLKSTPYYWMSDQVLFNKFPKLRKAFIKIRSMDTLTPIEIKRLANSLGSPPTPQQIRDAEKKKLDLLLDTEGEQGKKNLDAFSYQLRSLAQAEGKYAMASLLARLKTGVTNVFGGTTNTWVWVGAHNMRQARKIDVWTDINPNIDPKKGPVFKSMEDVHSWVKGLGVVEEMIIYEAGLIKKRFAKDKRVGSFINEATKRIIGGEELSDLTLKELWRKHGVSDKIGNVAAFAMRPTERYLRINSFLSSYLQARETMFPVEFELDNPWLVQQGLKGVKVSQFYYHAPYRPAFARTNVGKIYSRFKLWGWSSVKFRREVFQEAKYRGYKQGTQEFDRLQRLMIADAMMLGLANLLPYTMFDYGLPAPYAQLQDVAHWSFGDDTERDRAFYGVLPKAIAPLHELMPSILRAPEAIFGTMFTGAWDRLAMYTMVSLFPFGLQMRDISRAIDNPAMSLDFITGIPIHRLATAQEKLEKHGHKLYRGITSYRPQYGEKKEEEE